MSRVSKAITGLLLAPTLAVGQSNLFPIVRGESILIRGHGLRVEAFHNGIDAVAREIHLPEFRRVLFQILKLPEATTPRYAVGNTYRVQVSTLGLTKDSVESLATALGDYVDMRAGGHTANYAMDSLKQRLVESPTETNGFRATLFRSFPYLPRQWVQEDPFQPRIGTATNLSLSTKFVVVDGEIAWTYSVPLGNERVWEIRCDAREFDPNLRPKFAAAKEEAERNLEKRGIKKRSGYVHHFEAELDSILVRKYQIKRRNSRELNPGFIVD
jgi:hypothetical protein